MSVSFSELGLSPEILKAIADQGYTNPSPIQQQAIGAVLSRKDVMAAAQTGTGKTGAFALPMTQMLSQATQRPSPNHIRALILTPTRELAAQVAQSVSACHQYTSLRSGVVFGGVSINPQMKLLRNGCDILVATPGRLLDLFQQNAVKFGQIEMLVLDGSVFECGEVLGKGTWLRLPEDQPLSVTADKTGATVWIKSGHLPYAKPPSI